MSKKELHPTVLKNIPRVFGDRNCEERYRYYSNFSDLLYLLDRLRLPYEIGYDRKIAGEKVTFKTFLGYSRDVFPRSEDFYSEDLGNKYAPRVSLAEIEKWLYADWNLLKARNMRAVWHGEQAMEY